MARRPSLIKKTTKKPAVPKKTRSELYLYNLKHFGHEPTYTDKEITYGQYTRNLHWYNAMGTSNKEAKEYLVDYLKDSGLHDRAKKVKDVPDKWISTTAAWIARMWSRGAVLPSTAKDFFNDRLKEMLERDYAKAKMSVDSDDEEDKPVKVVVKKTVQDRMKEALDDFIGGIELECDKVILGHTNDFSLYEHMQANEIAPVQAKRVFDFYNPQLLEIEHAYNKTDAGIVEGYAAYSKEHLERLYDFYLMIIDDAERYQQNEKKVRKPRATKPVTSDKKLKDFKYMKSDNSNKLVSINPEQILGASELWVFSTKYNQLTVFRSSSPRGLDVHRTAITNFDEKQSMTKKLKAKDVPNVINEVLKGGKMTLRKLMDGIKGSDQRLQERMNENTIIMRAVK